MLDGSEGEAQKNRIDSYGVCSERVMANLVLCTICRKWIHGRSVKIKKKTPKMVKDKKNFPELCNISNTLWKQDMVLEGKRTHDLEKD